MMESWMMRLLALISLVVTATSYADAPAKCRVRSIHALKAAQGVDPKLASLEALFKKSPFDQFRTFKLLQETLSSVALAQQALASVPNGKKLGLTYLERIAAKERTFLRLKIEYPGLSTTYKVGEGDPILLVVGSHNDGTLILAIDCVCK